MLREPCVYILACMKNDIIHTGVTSNLPVRVRQHREKARPGVSSGHQVHRLVWFETHESMDSAIQREKQLKAGSPEQKRALVSQLNPNWSDLYCTLL